LGKDPENARDEKETIPPGKKRRIKKTTYLFWFIYYKSSIDLFNTKILIIRKKTLCQYSTDVRWGNAGRSTK
jgi:hypothetical protein